MTRLALAAALLSALLLNANAASAGADQGLSHEGDSSLNADDGYLSLEDNSTLGFDGASSLDGNIDVPSGVGRPVALPETAPSDPWTAFDVASAQ
jgi:hypothetical protein